MATTQTQRPVRVLVCCTGSVASIKLPNIIEELMKQKFDIKLVATQRALHFFSPDTLPVPVLTDEDEWKWTKRGDPVLHIELRRWADILLIAPLDANTMAKITHGICDNLLTCIVRAWDLQRPLLFTPAMNTHMWEHPLTAQQVAALKGFGYTEIPVIEKMLMCGDKGTGGMAEVPTIVEAVVRASASVRQRQQEEQDTPVK